MGKILVGTASWTDKSLVNSGWYPKDASNPEKRLRYYASQFPLVEADSTYYFLPTEKNSKLWAERTPDNFTFNIKAFSLLTQHPAKPKSIPEELSPPDKKNIYPKDLDPKVLDRVWDMFLEALEPLRSEGKLGCLLFQFPPWFPIGKRNRDYVLECAKRALPDRICVEFRNKTWMSEDNQKSTLEFLEGHGIPYVCVDMPQGFTSSILPVVAATAHLAVVRFHGRNSDEWESGSVQKRFKYDYSKDELSEWVPRIAKLHEEAETTHVLMNNCYRDYAQRNARELAELLKDLPEG
ncbi:MAG: DUF72 domain-containing protein [Actinomycetota bacterium]|nr:DUF72 domain-containing protein [Actinomycetota bacterium]